MNDPRRLPSFEDVHKNASVSGVADASGTDLTADQLRSLCAIPGLKRLDVASCTSLDDKDFGVLSIAESLEELSVAYTRIGRRGIRAASALSSLQSMDLSGCSDLDDEDFAILAEAASLRSLCLSSYLTDQGLRFLLRLPRLERLGLDWCPAVTAEGLSQLSVIPSLRDLSLAQCRCLDFSSGFLAAFTQLEDLNLSGCEQLIDEDCGGLAKLRNIKSLRLWGCSRLSDQGLVQLGQLNHLERLSFPGSDRYGDPSIRALASIDTLRTLYLGHSRQISGVDLPQLACLTRLETLILSSCDRLEASSLAGLSVATSLKRLDLFNTKALSKVDRGLFSGMRLLEELDLSFTGYQPDPTELACMEELTKAKVERLDDEQAEALSRLQHLRELKAIDASALTDRGFARLTSLPSLESLDLSSLHSVTDEGFQALGSVATLRELAVDEAPLVTDVGLQALVTLDALLEINLREFPKITEAPLEDLVRRRELLALDVSCDNISSEALQRLYASIYGPGGPVAPSEEEPIEIFVKHNWLIGTGFDDVVDDADDEEDTEDEDDSGQSLVRYGIAIFANRSGCRHLADHFLEMAKSVPGVSDWDPGDHHHLTPRSPVSDEIEFTTDLVTRGNRATVLQAASASEATASRGGAIEQLGSFMADLCDAAPSYAIDRLRSELRTALERLHAAEQRLASRPTPESET